jgi:hypothetical protein
VKNLFNKNFSPIEKTKGSNFSACGKVCNSPKPLTRQGSQKPFDQTFGEAKKFGSINRRKDKLQI